MPFGLSIARKDAAHQGRTGKTEGKGDWTYVSHEFKALEWHRVSTLEWRSSCVRFDWPTKLIDAPDAPMCPESRCASTYSQEKNVTDVFYLSFFLVLSCSVPNRRSAGERPSRRTFPDQMISIGSFGPALL